MRKTKKAKQKKEILESRVSILNTLPNKYKNLIAVVIILLPLLFYFGGWILDGLQPIGNDSLGSIGQTHRWVEWNKEHGETVLWNPSIFGGEPIYSRITPKILHVDTALNYVAKISYWAFIYLFMGGLGLFYLLRYKKIPWYAAVIAAVVFTLLPDWQAQIGEGHNSKLRAIMTLPWLVLSFSYLFDKKDWLGTGLFALAFTWLVRTHHFQIVFYGILILFVIYIYPTVKLIIDKKYKDVISLFTKFAIALVLTFMVAAQPLFTTHEYAEHSTRGGNPVKIGEEASSAKKGGGVSFEYATQWSFAPSEIMSFFIPRFNGGLQGEVYDGEKFPHLKGQQVPGYWGAKPFNGNYASMGMILFLFAIIGVAYFRKDKFVLGLAVFTVLSILLSFGRHFPELYELFFYYVPYFSKFRAPSMILNITFITTLILAGYGIKGIVELYKPQDIKWVFSIFGGGLLLAFATLLFSDSFAYVAKTELGRYDANTLNAIKEIRKEFLIADTQKLLLFLIPTIGIVFLFLFKKIKLEIFALLLLLVSVSEILTISNRAHKTINLDNLKQLEKSVYKETPITKVLASADDNYRAIVLGSGFTSNHYAYFYPLISGYSAIKLQVIQDVIAHNLYNANTPDRINWNIINMMGGKYIISSAQIAGDSLQTIAMDKVKKEILYFNPNAFNKAWFIKELKPLPTKEDVVLEMNKLTFNPANTALFVGSGSSKQFSGIGNIEVVSKTPNRIELEVNSDSNQFLVLSEIYYSDGWIAKLNGTEIPIVKTNHLLRGVEVVSGNHKLVFEFVPSTYSASVTAVWIGDVLIWLLILGGGYLIYKKRIAT
ncbi:MAG: YfhO family protein [Melioribacteraceae bacterium]|nr:YfhO family protein [Melioribacteraceae bacterium]